MATKPISHFINSHKEKTGLCFNQHHEHSLQSAETTLTQMGLIDDNTCYWPSTIARHNPDEPAKNRTTEILTIIDGKILFIKKIGRKVIEKMLITPFGLFTIGGKDGDERSRLSFVNSETLEFEYLPFCHIYVSDLTAILTEQNLDYCTA